MKRVILLSLLLVGCDYNPLTNEQVKMVADSCQAKGGVVEVINNSNESSARCKFD